MQRKTAADFHPEVLLWVDRYVHGLTDRRGFLNGVAKYATGGVTASMLLDALNPRFAEAQQVAKDDARIKATYVDVASPDGYGKIRAYLVRPANATRRRVMPRPPPSSRGSARSTSSTRTCAADWQP